MEKISVVVPCRNEEKTIGKLIDQIEKQKGTGEFFDWELLVVEGRSTDATREIVKMRARLNKKVILVDNKKRITPVARNLGIKNAKGKYVCLIDAHSEIANDYFLQSLRISQKIGADNVGGPWNGVGQTYIGKAIAAAFRSPFSAGGSKSHNINFEGFTDSVWGGFFRKDIFRKIGLFDEELIRNQDEELNFRLVKSGGKIWQSKKIHYKYFVRDKLSKLFKQYFQYGYWKVKLMQKHKYFASIKFLVPAIFVLTMIIFAILAYFNHWFRLLFFMELIFYLLFDLYFSIVCGFKNSLKYLPVLPAVFFIFHFAFGLGTIFGFFSFVIMKKTYKNMSSLSR